MDRKSPRVREECNRCLASIYTDKFGSGCGQTRCALCTCYFDGMTTEAEALEETMRERNLSRRAAIKEVEAYKQNERGGKGEPLPYPNGYVAEAEKSEEPEAADETPDNTDWILERDDNGSFYGCYRGGARLVVRKVGTGERPWILVVIAGQKSGLVHEATTAARLLTEVTRGIHDAFILRTDARLKAEGNAFTLPAKDEDEDEPAPKQSLFTAQVYAGQELQNAQIARQKSWEDMAHNTVYDTPERFEAIKQYAVLLDEERVALNAWIAAHTALIAKYGYPKAKENAQ